MSFLHRWRGTIAYVALALGVLAAFAGVEAERADRAYAICQRSNGQATVLLHLVEDAGKPGTRIDLTAIPSFRALDANTQRYLSDLNAALNAPAKPGETFLDRAKKIVTFEDCKKYTRWP